MARPKKERKRVELKESEAKKLPYAERYRQGGSSGRRVIRKKLGSN